MGVDGGRGGGGVEGGGKAVSVCMHCFILTFRFYSTLLHKH